MRGPVVASRSRTTGPRELAAADQEAWDAGYAAGQASGHRAGLEAAAAQISARENLLDQQIKSLASMLDALSAPLREFDSITEQELCRLALTVGKHLARRELDIDPAQVIAIVRDTVSLLPAAARHVRVHLHPLDAAIVRERLAAPGHDAAWTIVEDPVMGRGGCRVSTDHAHIDARLENRVATLLTELCGEHSGDHGPDGPGG